MSKYLVVFMGSRLAWHVETDVLFEPGRHENGPMGSCLDRERGTARPNNLVVPSLARSVRARAERSEWPSIPVWQRSTLLGTGHCARQNADLQRAYVNTTTFGPSLHLSHVNRSRLHVTSTQAARASLNICTCSTTDGFA